MFNDLFLYNLVFKSIETKIELSISFIAFKIKIAEPPLEVPISMQFLGLIFLIIPLRK